MAKNKKPTIKPKIKGNLVDPTNNFQSIVTDEDNITGMTTNTSQAKTYDLNYPSRRSILQGMSDAEAKRIKEEALDPNEEKETKAKPERKAPEEKGLLDELHDQATGNETLDDTDRPSIYGEQSISGDMPDPASDDDVLENAHDMGFGMDEDSEHPKPLDMGSEIDKGEDEHRRGREK